MEKAAPKLRKGDLVVTTEDLPIRGASKHVIPSGVYGEVLSTGIEGSEGYWFEVEFKPYAPVGGDRSKNRSWFVLDGDVVRVRDDG